MSDPSVCYLVDNLDGPGFYRCLFPMRELRKKGWDATIPPFRVVEHKGRGEWNSQTGTHPAREEFFHSTTIWNPENLDFEADLWVVQRGQARRLKGTSKALIVENDDNSLHLPKWHRSYAKRHKANEEMHAGFRCADAMTVSTPQLAEDYADYCGRIFVLRNYLDWEMWADVPQQSEVERERIRIGWMGAHDFRVGDLQQLRGVLGPWLERHPQTEFVVAGYNAEKTHDLLGIPRAQRISVPGVDFSSGRLPEITAVMDIGLVPLEPGRFNEAKSHLKGMEYGACGIPCVATPTESYRYYLTEGTDGLYASKPGEWRAALETLVGDDAYRRECGRNARAKAARHTIQEHAWRWEEVYRAVGGKSDPGLPQPLLLGAGGDVGEHVLARAASGEVPDRHVDLPGDPVRAAA